MKFAEVIGVTNAITKIIFWWCDFYFRNSSVIRDRTRGEWGRLYADDQNFRTVSKVLSCQQPSDIFRGKHT